MYTHILIPTDGSVLAQAGVSHGLALAKQHGAKVTVVSVTEAPGGQFAYSSDLWTPDEADQQVLPRRGAIGLNDFVPCVHRLHCQAV